MEGGISGFWHEMLRRWQERPAGAQREAEREEEDGPMALQGAAPRLSPLVAAFVR